MQCKCGGLMTSSEHQVTTDKGAKEWGAESAPIRVIQIKCKCTRSYLEVWKDGIRIK